MNNIWTEGAIGQFVAFLLVHTHHYASTARHGQEDAAQLFVPPLGQKKGMELACNIQDCLRDWFLFGLTQSSDRNGGIFRILDWRLLKTGVGAIACESFRKLQTHGQLNARDYWQRNTVEHLRS